MRKKSRAYTLVLEHFESHFNAAIGQKMNALKAVLISFSEFRVQYIPQAFSKQVK
jgi:hypothetical protein